MTAKLVFVHAIELSALAKEAPFSGGSLLFSREGATAPSHSSITSFSTVVATAYVNNLRNSFLKSGTVN